MPSILFRTMLVFVTLLSIRPVYAEDWPRWRGPRLDGISRETGLLKQWPKDGPRQLWSAKLSGGFSGIVVADGRLFTQTKDKDQEIVVCFDAATGKELWRFAYECDYKAYPSFTGGGMPKSRTGPRASPAVDGDRVYTLGATGILLCLETKTGRQVWRQELLKLAERTCPSHGYCGSPLVVGDRIYLELGGKNGKALAALNKSNGSVAWQALDEPLGQASAVWADVGGTSQVIFFMGTGAVGVAPEDGKLLWRFPWKTQYDLNIATPIYTAGHVFISSNYGSGGALLKVNGTATPEVIWKSKAMQSHHATAVLYEGHLYGTSENRLRCVDFKTGQPRWDQAGFGKGPVALADGHLIALGDHGELALVRATPEAYTEVSRCQVFDKGTLTWTVPVIANGRLYIRCENGLVALDVRGDRRGASE